MKKNSYLFILILISIIIRIIIYLTMEYQVSGDTSGYINLAEHISKCNFNGYNGSRTPTYPLIIAISNLNMNIVYITQLIMGIVITIISYLIMYLLTSNKKYSFYFGIIITTYIPFLSYENVILSEMTSMFFLLFSLFFVFKYIKSINWKWLFITSFTISLLILTRPVYLLILLPFLLLIFLINKSSYKKVIFHIFILIIPIILIVSSWCLVNLKVNDQFTISTMSGFSLTNRVGYLMEDAPENYKQIKDIYISERDKHIKSKGTYVNTIWHSWFEMSKKTELSYAELSLQVKKMCIDIIKKHPTLYIKDSINNWVKFWKPASVSKSFPNYTHLFSKYFQRVLFVIFEFIFLLVTPIYLLKNKHNLYKSNYIFVLMCLMFVLIISIGYSVLENVGGRYSIPTDPIIIIISIFLIFNYKRKNVIKSNK